MEVVPIVSSVKLAKISEKLGASAIVVEGTEAGGHLGTQQSIKDLIPEIVAAVHIPVIAAGGAAVAARGVRPLGGLAGVRSGRRRAGRLFHHAGQRRGAGAAAPFHRRRPARRGRVVERLQRLRPGRTAGG